MENGQVRMQESRLSDQLTNKPGQVKTKFQVQVRVQDSRAPLHLSGPGPSLVGDRRGRAAGVFQDFSYCCPRTRRLLRHERFIRMRREYELLPSVQSTYTPIKSWTLRVWMGLKKGLTDAPLARRQRSARRPTTATFPRSDYS